ncbi:MAG: COX15/CtaA family protein [Anaerolineales bacterium]
MNRFQKWAVATTAATFLLIIIGGLVRASDAGLGCPDWPTCFGEPYPPLTMAELAERDVPADFDLASFEIRLAWIEWINRATGAVIGLLVVATLAAALVDHRDNKRILYPTIGAFITVVINGWVGSLVIESRLQPIVISVHLLLAWVQVSLLLLAAVSAFYPQGGLPRGELPPERRILARAALVVLFLGLVQGGLGADLRGQLEVIEKENPEMARGAFIHEADWVDPVHRSFSWVVMAGVFGLAYYAHTRIDYNPALRYTTQGVVVLTLAQIGAGIGLAYVNLPPALQVVHLINGTFLLAAITMVYLLATRLPIAAAAPATDDTREPLETATAMD